jgi:hypothetical protein
MFSLVILVSFELGWIFGNKYALKYKK